MIQAIIELDEYVGGLLRKTTEPLKVGYKNLFQIKAIKPEYVKISQIGDLRFHTIEKKPLGEEIELKLNDSIFLVSKDETYIVKITYLKYSDKLDPRIPEELWPAIKAEIEIMVKEGLFSKFPEEEFIVDLYFKASSLLYNEDENSTNIGPALREAYTILKSEQKDLLLIKEKGLVIMYEVAKELFENGFLEEMPSDALINEHCDAIIKENDQKIKPEYFKLDYTEMLVSKHPRVFELDWALDWSAILGAINKISGLSIGYSEKEGEVTFTANDVSKTYSLPKEVLVNGKHYHPINEFLAEIKSPYRLVLVYYEPQNDSVMFGVRKV